MVKRVYVPDRGDLVWLSFDPGLGHEQLGRRPAVVMSPRSYNVVSGLAVVCPVTSRAKGYAFEVPVVFGAISGVILADQIKSIDWKKRRIRYVTTMHGEAFSEVLAKARTLLG